MVLSRTKLTFILQLLVTVEVPDPMLNPRSLHISDESTNTNKKHNMFITVFSNK